jgi:transcriptional regulator with XRE-family HTH domain
MAGDTHKQDIGERIRTCRLEKGLTQAEFSEGMDISVNFLSEIENGKKAPSCETLYHLCYEYSISADYVLFGETPDDKEDIHAIIDYAQDLSNDQLNTLIEYLSALLKVRNLDS